MGVRKVYSANNAVQESNCINLIGRLNEVSNIDEEKVKQITEDVLIEHEFKNWNFRVSQDESLNFNYTWPIQGNMLDDAGMVERNKKEEVAEGEVKVHDGVVDMEDLINKGEFLCGCAGNKEVESEPKPKTIRRIIIEEEV